jgi:hypothetical protein
MKAKAPAESLFLKKGYPLQLDPTWKREYSMV